MRGIEGMERMRLVRDDIKSRVQQLYSTLGGTKAQHETAAPCRIPAGGRCAYSNQSGQERIRRGPS